MPFGRNFISISQISALYGEVTWKGRSKRTSYFSKTQRRILFLTLYISAVVPAMYTHTHPFNGLIPLTFRLKVEERSQAYKLLCQCGRQRTRKQRCGAVAQCLWTSLTFRGGKCNSWTTSPEKSTHFFFTFFKKWDFFSCYKNVLPSWHWHCLQFKQHKKGSGGKRKKDMEGIGGECHGHFVTSRMRL